MDDVPLPVVVPNPVILVRKVEPLPPTAVAWPVYRQTFFPSAQYVPVYCPPGTFR